MEEELRKIETLACEAVCFAAQAGKIGAGGLIVMGNEANGISPELRSRISAKLFIPPYPGNRKTAESLNVAIATAITVSEFRRRR